MSCRNAQSVGDDKVRNLPPRGSTKKTDPTLWQVMGFSTKGKHRLAELARLDAPDETTTVPLDDLVVVAEFGDTIYPGLTSTGSVSRGGDKPCHTVINGENYHVLKALTWTHRGKIDAIYIDPPYNTRDRDWKYNNHYVNSDDLYRHSKWLAMMERRLRVAKELLNPADAVLIVTIDENEYLHLGLLLEQMFPDATIQMISSVIKPEGTNRAGEFSRTNEYVFFVMFGVAKVDATSDDMSGRKQTVSNKRIEWRNLRRRESTSIRSARPNQFYAVFVDPAKETIHSIGKALPPETDKATVPVPEGCYAVFPLKPDGTEMLWGLTPNVLRSRLKQGYARVSRAKDGPQKVAIQYLARGTVQAIERGDVAITGRDDQGAVQGVYSESAIMPKTTWNKGSHNAQTSGTLMLTALIPNRKFPFPKSLYAVEDALRFFVADKPSAIVLDFFSGSGTTAHAVMRLNQQDGGERQCISVTNNEVGADEHEALTTDGLRPGDPEWEQWGICDYITKPRVAAAITGKTPDGESIVGEYQFGNIVEKEKSRSFRQIGFGDSSTFTSATKKKQLVALVEGLPQKLVTGNCPFIVSEDHTSSVLFDSQRLDDWLGALDGHNHITHFYIVTPVKRTFELIKEEVLDLLGPIIVSEEAGLPMSDGFEENAAFFTLTYETPIAVNHQTAFKRIAPMLWLRAGSVGRMIESRPTAGWEVADSYGLLENLDKSTDFLKAVHKAEQLKIAYIVTDDERRFQTMARHLPDGVEAIRLYESYLTNFAFANGETT